MGDPIINTQVDAINATLGNIKVDLAALRPSIRAIKDAIAETYLTDTIENVPIASFSDGADEIPVRELQVAIEPVQSGIGDPSPTNVRPIIGWDKAQILQSQLAEISAANGRLIFPWKDGNTEYNPEMNLCLVTDAQLADSSTVHGTYFEWDKTLPFGVPFDEPEAIYYFDGTEGAGQKYITIGKNYGTGWVAGQSIQITLTSAPANGDQLVINCGTNSANDPTSGRTWNVYGKGSTTSKQSGTTSQGTSGAKLGETNSADVGKTNGRVNAPQRVVFGYNRWSQSLLRQYLNATTASGWYEAANAWDRPNTTTVAREGFLYGYGEDVYSHFKPIKVVTVACNADNNVEDVTYDRVFLSSLEQMYYVPQFSGKEGSYWEYYKRLLGRTSPAPTSATYARLIKYALNAPTSAQYCWRRSAYRYGAGNAWIVYASGGVDAGITCNAYGCAPSVFISAEDIKITDITWQDTVGTVYGGALNVTTGVLTINMAMVDLGTLTWTYSSQYNRFAATSANNPTLNAKPTATNYDVGNILCDRYATTYSNKTAENAGNYMIAVGSGGGINVRDENYTDAATFKTAMNGVQLCYELATPTTVQLTAAEVETLFGQNNVWCSSGNIIKLTYRKAWEIALAEGE